MEGSDVVGVVKGVVKLRYRGLGQASRSAERVGPRSPESPAGPGRPRPGRVARARAGIPLVQGAASLVDAEQPGLTMHCTPGPDSERGRTSRT